MYCKKQKLKKNARFSYCKPRVNLLFSNFVTDLGLTRTQSLLCGVEEPQRTILCMPLKATGYESGFELSSLEYFQLKMCTGVLFELV